MLVLPLNLRIFKLVGGLVCISTMAILVTVWYSTSQQVSSLIKKDLEIGQSVIRQVFENREKILFTAADVLTDDFGFKAAVASADEDTISSALENHGRRIASDLMAVLSLKGETIASNAADLSADFRFQEKSIFEQALDDGGAISVIMFGGKIYQIILLTVDAPAPIAVALVGFEVDKNLLEELKATTKLDIIMAAQNEGVDILVSSLSKQEQTQALAATASILKGSTPLFNDDQQFISHKFALSDVDGNYAKITVTLAEKLSNWSAEFSELLLNIFTIALVFIGLALGLGLVFSNNLSKPLSNLVVWANRISAGEYEAPKMLPAKSKEINNLSDAFELMQKDIQSREEKIQYQANHDPSTGLINRYEIVNILEKLFQREATFQAFGFKVIGLREVNTAFGHQSGDQCVSSLADRLSRLGGVSARLTDDELLWIPSRSISTDEMFKIKQALETPHKVAGLDIILKLAIGALIVPHDTQNNESFFRNLSVAVDSALEDPKLFKNYEPGMEEDYLKRLSILRELELALDQQDQELNLLYQPKLDLDSGRILKVEALIRWNSKALGFVPPDVFIPIAEKAGLINEITRWVYRRAIRDAAAWKAEGRSVKIAINLSVHDVMNEKLMNDMHSELVQSGLNTDHLEFELTESDLMTNPENAIRLLEQLRDRGYSLAIDDFGTGYSSLAYLKHMPVSELKIDMSFIRNLENDENDQLIVKSIIELAKRFNLKIVAEGVETEASLLLLKQWGCDWIQGYFISKPIDLKNLQQWLEENKTTKWI